MQKKTEQKVRQEIRKSAVAYLKNSGSSLRIYYDDEDRFFLDLPLCRPEDRFTEAELTSLSEFCPRVKFFWLLRERYRDLGNDCLDNIVHNFMTAHKAGEFNHSVCRDIFESLLQIYYPSEHYLSQKIGVSLVLDRKNWNCHEWLLRQSQDYNRITKIIERQYDEEYPFLTGRFSLQMPISDYLYLADALLRAKQLKTADELAKKEKALTLDPLSRFELVDDSNRDKDKGYLILDRSVFYSFYEEGREYIQNFPVPLKHEVELPLIWLLALETYDCELSPCQEINGIRNMLVLPESVKKSLHNVQNKWGMGPFPDTLSGSKPA